MSKPTKYTGSFAKNKLPIIAFASIIFAMFIYISADSAASNAAAGLNPGVYSAANGNSVVATLAFDSDGIEDFANMLNDSDNGEAVSTPAKTRFPVWVRVDGMKRRVMTSKRYTVEQILETAGIELGKYDVVSPGLDKKLSEGETIVVTRRTQQVVKRKESLPYQTIITYSPDFAPGEEKVLVKGVDGRHTVSVRQLLVDGEVVEEKILSSDVELDAIDKKVIRGFPVKPVSSFDFEYEFNEKLEPIEYTDVLRGEKSAGYSAPKGALTASGRKAIVGHVAVDPKVIPYGTKLFIKSTDNRHIYGYAVAADTGIALKQGIIAVDLLYGTYDESAANGIRKVDIFILE